MKEWKEYRLGDLIELKNGFAFKSKDFIQSGIPVIKIKNVKPNRILLDDLSFVAAETAQHQRCVKILPTDILITMTGNRKDGGCDSWVGKVALFKKEGEFLLNQRVAAIKVKRHDIINYKYLAYLLSSWESQLYFINNSNSSGGQANISPEIVNNYIIYIPSLYTQNSIANILSSIDDKIEFNRRINENLKQQAQALFKSWFVDFEPFKDGKFVYSELGMIPGGWKVGNLGELVEVKYGKDHKKLASGTIPVYGSGGIMRYVDQYLYNKESVLIPRKGSLNNVMYVNHPFWTVDTMFYTHMKIEGIAKFIYLLISPKDLLSMNSGSAVPSMTVDILNKIAIIIPSTTILQQFESIVKPIFIMAESLQKENQKLAHLRDTLLPKLMSGELKINDLNI